MDPEFSRRVAKAINSWLFINMSVEDRSVFINACSKAKNFDDLPKQWKDKIVESEQ